ncbi:ROK family protein [Microbacterium sp. SLBN-146]|uniref:ROK family protein n=1 Tax=Microbacterium sp. SLBN-146 TaxID=2768457 RepID=UPI0021B441B6|nr:ROK family protein [Microbacterium sp. SLBN-146]
MTRLAKPFLDRGILVEQGETQDGSVGRPTRPLDIAPDLGVFIGVKLTGDRVYAALTDVRARLLATSEAPIEKRDPEAVVAAVEKAIDSFGTARPNGIGVSIGGVVSDGVVEFAPFLGWQDVDFAAALSQRTNAPVTVENDLVALAEAERWFGLGRGIDGFSVITIGEGIGYALVVHGEVVRSREAGVGLGGHLPLAATGPLCAEGHRGCAQALLTSGSIAAQVSGALQRPVEYDEVLKLASEGNPAARAVTGAAADALGRFVALAANLTMQPAVVLAGDGVALFALEESRVRAAIAADRDPRADPIAIYVDDSSFTAWARGAAAVAIQAAVAGLTLDP